MNLPRFFFHFFCFCLSLCFFHDRIGTIMMLLTRVCIATLVAETDLFNLWIQLQSWNFLFESQRSFFQSIWYDQLDLPPLLYQALDLINLCWKCHASPTDRTCLECCWRVILENLILFAGTRLNQSNDCRLYILLSWNLIGSMKILKVFFFVHWGTKTRSFWRKCFKVYPPSNHDFVSLRQTELSNLK